MLLRCTAQTSCNDLVHYLGAVPTQLSQSHNRVGLLGQTSAVKAWCALEAATGLHGPVLNACDVCCSIAAQTICLLSTSSLRTITLQNGQNRAEVHKLDKTAAQ